MPHASRTALITGASKNIGRACAHALAKSGCNVVVNGASDVAAAQKVAGEVRSFGVEALVAIGDVGRREDAVRIGKQAIEAFGAVDVLVNNAAIRRDASFLEMNEDEWRYTMAVNFDSAYWLSRLCLPEMLTRKWGRIINFAGMNAINGYDGRRAHVCAAKHAAWGLTRALAKEFGAAGVTVNIVSPGPTVGEDHDAAVASHITKMAARVPGQRIGAPEQIAGIVAFLASEAASYVNGQIIQVNGGAET